MIGVAIAAGGTDHGNPTTGESIPISDTVTFTTTKSLTDSVGVSDTISLTHLQNH